MLHRERSDRTALRMQCGRQGTLVRQDGRPASQPRRRRNRQATVQSRLHSAPGSPRL